MLVASQALCKRLLVPAIAPTTGVLGKGVVMLFTNTITLTPDTAYADLTEATFNGYARSSVIVWLDPYVDQDGVVIVVGDRKAFVAGAAPVGGQTVQGYAVIEPATSPAVPTLLFAENFDTPFQIVNPGDVIPLVPTFTTQSQAQSD